MMRVEWKKEGELKGRWGKEKVRVEEVYGKGERGRELS